MPIKRIISSAVDTDTQKIAPPVVTGISTTSLSSSGGETVQIYGNNFQIGVSVYLGTTQSSTVTRANSSYMTFRVPSTTPGTYSLYVVNPNGGSAVLPVNVYSLDAYWTPGGLILAQLNKNNRSVNQLVSMDSGINYSLVSGTLPSGITFDANTRLVSGTISNVQIDTTTYNFTLQAFHTGYGVNFTHDYAIVFTSVYPTWSTSANLGIITEASVSRTITATSDSTVTYQVLSSLPSGLSIDANTGVISGAITPPDSYYSTVTLFNIQARATDQEFNSTDQTFTLTYVPTIPTWQTAAILPTCYRTYAYSQSLVATGATSMTYALTTGSLPPGITLNSAGLLSGTPTTQGTYNFTVRATDTNTHASAKTFTLICASPYIQATGGTITTSGGFRIHTFNSSGGFDVSTAPPGATVETLIVAGGGGGGAGPGGGGGAGGYLSINAAVAESTSYSIVVGSGGAGATAMGAGAPYGSDGVLRSGSSGLNSSAFGNVAVGGGYGALGAGGTGGGSGGSGGGGSGRYNSTTGPVGVGGSGQAGPPRQGYDGGTGGSNIGGGGGGAGSGGGTGGGGNGITLPIVGGNAMGGGQGGGSNSGTTAWGGGSGGNNSTGFRNEGITGGGNATTTGSGGGGGAGGFGGFAFYQYASGGGNGAGGTVIIRYPFI